MKKVSTGIPGLDDLIGGGLIEGSTVLVSGCTGTGRTIFGLQFLYSGARDHGEPGILVTLESRPEEIRTSAMQLGWDLAELERDRLLVIVDAASSKAGLPTSEKYALRRGFDMTTFAEEIYRAIGECNARRLVIDSLSGLGIRSGEPFETRSELFRIGALLRELKVTSILVGETSAANDQSIAGVEQFVCQGLISLNLVEHDGGLERSLVIWKMHNTAHSLKRHQFVIGKKGITIVTPRSRGASRS
jgi:KaiC/GvpD/RAD55 family RecA-like ATPase